MDYFGVAFQFTNIHTILTFTVVFVVVISSLVRNISQWHKNEKAPRLSVEAEVVAKRSARQRPMSNKRYSGRDYTNYYVTFQFESGDRLEMHIPWNQFGYLVEGDRGKLSFQGTRFLGFERI